MADLSYDRQIKQIHAMKRELALSEDSYRALIHKVSAGRKDSSKDLNPSERGLLIDEMKRLGAGKKTKAKKPGHRPHDAQATSAKARALWITLWNLGAIDDNTDDALATFVKRQTKVDDLRFLRPGQAHKVIDGLKAMAARKGVNWSSYANPKCCVIRAQLNILSKDYGIDLPAIPFLTDDFMDMAISNLGKRIRCAKSGRKTQENQAA